MSDTDDEVASDSGPTGDTGYDGLAEPTRSLLITSGWSPGRRVDVAHETALLRDKHHQVGPVVADFLARFCGLTVRLPSTVPRRRARVFHFNIEEACQLTHEGFVGNWEIPADDHLCLIGHLTNGNMALVMSKGGIMYAGKRSRLFLLGRTPAEGLDRLCSETPVEEWPQQLPPLRTGPQLLLKATPRVPVHDASSAASQALKYSVLNSGPVLACVDLGDVWRVFRSWSPTSLMAPLVPMLVDKSNGDLYNDWPFRSGGPTAQDAFLRLLQEVGPRLRELGFQGSGTGWRHSDADRYLCLVFIRFRSSTAVASTFYLTASIIAKEHWEQLRAEDPGLPSQPPTTGYQGTRFEIGQHHGMPVRFHVLAGADNNWMAGCVLDTIERVILSQASRTQEG